MIRNIKKLIISTSEKYEMLHAFKEAGIRWATSEEISNEAWKMTTNNGGTSIRVR